MWNDTTTRNRCLNKRIQLFISTNSKLQVSGRNTLDFQVLACVSRQFEYFSSQILENGGTVNSSFGSNADILQGTRFEVPVDTADGEL